MTQPTPEQLQKWREEFKEWFELNLPEGNYYSVGMAAWQAARAIDAQRTAELETALQNSLAKMERDEICIEEEWGDCRSLEHLEADGDLSPEILEARIVLAAAKRKGE